jgi:DNA-binding transcriptional ArsR family regulator
MDEFKDIASLDRLIHEPSRLAIMAVLSAVESADFTFLLNSTRLSKGNLSAHAAKLRDAGYVQIEKSFKDNYPHTTYRLTPEGRKAFKRYHRQIKGWTSRVDQSE